MNKIMFNDKYGLTQAVLGGRKTMTRRIVPEKIQKLLDAATRPIIVPLTQIPDGQSIEEFAEQFAKDYKAAPLFIRDGKEEVKVEPSEKEIMAAVIAHSAYKVGDVVAVAESYKKMYERSLDYALPRYSLLDDYDGTPGWTNKMFVMPEKCSHKIRITDVRVERLQDISCMDCVSEGVIKNGPWKPFNYAVPGFSEWFETPQKAFAALIDKISGKGTWEKNPWVFVYTFDLVK